MKFLRVLTYIYQAYQPKPWRLSKPTVIQFPVNDICNAGCQMCNIWQHKLGYQITPSELEIALRNPLFSDVRTVGVNGGEPTLRKDLAELTEVMFRTLPKLESISLITNALVHKKVIDRIAEVGHSTRKYRANFDVMVSLDGVGDVHNLVRGRKNNFENALTVLDFLQETDLVTRLRLGCTVVRDNVYGLHDLHDFALERGIYIKYRLAIPHKRLYSENLIEPYALNLEEKIHFCVFLENIIQHYETSEQQKFFYRSLIDQVLHGKSRQAGCAWQHRGATITSRGELLYCAVKSKTLGSVIKEDSEQLYFENHPHLTEIVQNECDLCLHDYIGLPPGHVFVQQLFKEAATRAGIPPDLLTADNLPQPIKRLGQRIQLAARLKHLCLQGATNTPVTKTLKAKDATRPTNILICGWYGTETLGDKVILAGIVSALNQILGNARFRIASLQPYLSCSTIRQMPELSGIEVVDIADTLLSIDTNDMVVFGGGPVMAIKNIAEMLAIFEAAAGHQIPSILAGCGVGPLGSSYQNMVIKRLLSLASGRIYRDTRSLDYASELGIATANDLVAEDPAFTWLAVKQQAHTPKPVVPNRGTRLILGLRDWPHQQYAPHLSLRKARTIKQHFEQQIINSLLDLSSQYPELTIIPYPMCTNHYGGDDRWFYRRIFHRHKQLRKRVDYSVLSRELRPDEAFDVFCSADAALTMRFHSLVFAISLNIPAVACDYTLGRGKVTALAEASGVPYRPIDRIDAEFLTKTMNSAIKQRRRHKNTKATYAPRFTQALRSTLQNLL